MQGTDPVSKFRLLGNLQGHTDLITCIATGHPQNNEEDSQLVISGSKDKNIIVWKLNDDPENNKPGGNTPYGVPLTYLAGHNNLVSDIAISNKNNYALSSSWDKTLRLWDLTTETTRQVFEGHTQEVHSVCFSLENRHIFSGGDENSYKLWNTLGDCKWTSFEDNHTNSVSYIRFSPDAKNEYFATVGRDGKLQIWDLATLKMRHSIQAHKGSISSLSIAPSGTSIATGGEDGILKIWDMKDLSKEDRIFKTGSPINMVCFNPKKQWIAVACKNGIQVFDLVTASEDPIGKLVIKKPKMNKADKPETYECTALAWTSNGSELYAAFNDNVIRAYEIVDE